MVVFRVSLYLCTSHCTSVSGNLQALQACLAAELRERPEGGDEVHYSHHRGPTEKLPSLVSYQMRSNVMLYNT